MDLRSWQVMEGWACCSGRHSHAAKVDQGVTRIEYDEKAIENLTLLPQWS